MRSKQPKIIDYDDLMKTTLRKYQATIVDNISKANPILAYLRGEEALDSIFGYGRTQGGLFTPRELHPDL